MKLEKLLAPIKAVDERILKGYTEVSQGISDKTLYKMTTGISFSGYLLTPLLNSLVANLGVGFAYAFVDNAYNFLGLMGNIKTNDQDGEALTIGNPIISSLKKINRTFRLPIFTAGVSLVGKSVYDLGNYFINGEPLPPETMDVARAGIGTLMIASSMYMKDRNPKLLQKKPLWKKASEYLKEKTKIYIPAWEKA